MQILKEVHESQRAAKKSEERGEKLGKYVQKKKDKEETFTKGMENQRTDL